MTPVTNAGLGKLTARLMLMAVVAASALAECQTVPQLSPGDGGLKSRQTPGRAAVLYDQLRSVRLDTARVYNVREASFRRGALQFSLRDGTIAFSRDVEGRVTAAFFEGEGEVLLRPPDKVERASLALFTGATILEETFVNAYFRFNDQTFEELSPWLRKEDGNDFVGRWDKAAGSLADLDALRLFLTFSQSLNFKDGDGARGPFDNQHADQFFRAQLRGAKLGLFDLYYDTLAAEQIAAGQLVSAEQENFYNLWTSFSIPAKARTAGEPGLTRAEELRNPEWTLSHYEIDARISPPTTIQAQAKLQLRVMQSGSRTLFFELSRFLEIKEVSMNGRPVEFIHNPALEGSDRARRGNDLVAVVLSEPLKAGKDVDLTFEYSGDVISEAGPGLLYVGARGTWYPNRGLAMSNFDLTFHYPAEWTLVATGKRENSAAAGREVAGLKTDRWLSEREMPVAGFNLGKYSRATAQAEDHVAVESYATDSVERNFPKTQVEAMSPQVFAPPGSIGPRAPLMVTPPPPSPSQNAQAIADRSAEAINFFSRSFGPYPFGKLALTQMPGPMSQGWPGLIFLSSFAFLTPKEESELHLTTSQIEQSDNLVAHETAHQWWGDLVTWSSYRDQWIMEALANYSALMLMEKRNPQEFQSILESYRDALLAKNKSGVALMQAGPVTLGNRLSSSEFPQGYEAISYGRGTWLIHMLRGMMQEGSSATVAGRRAHIQASAGKSTGDQLFLSILKAIRDRYQGKPLSTEQLVREFEQRLPPSCWYGGKRSLTWFYEGWIEGTAIPAFELKSAKYSDIGGATVITGVIVQKSVSEGLVTPVPVYGSVAGRRTNLGQVFVDEAETKLRIIAPLGTRKLVLDPAHVILSRSR